MFGRSRTNVLEEVRKLLSNLHSQEEVSRLMRLNYETHCEDIM